MITPSPGGTYSLLIKAPGWDLSGIRGLVDQKLKGVILMDARQIADTKLWRATIDLAPWRVRELYSWYAESDRLPPQGGFPPGTLLLFKAHTTPPANATTATHRG